MALRSGYKGYKKLAEGLKEFWPGILGADIPALMKTFLDWSSYAKTGAYNLFPYPYSHTSQSEDNTTFTVNDDGTITIVANNPSANQDFYIQGNAYWDAPNKFLPNGQYAFSCEGLSNNVKVYMGKPSTSAYYNFSDTDTHTIASSDSNPLQYCFIRVVAGATVNVTLKPLITLPNAKSRTFVPFAMTNQELTKIDAYRSLTLTVPNTATTVSDMAGNAMTQLVNLLPYDGCVADGLIKWVDNDNYFFNALRIRKDTHTIFKLTITASSHIYLVSHYDGTNTIRDVQSQAIE